MCYWLLDQGQKIKEFERGEEEKQIPSCLDAMWAGQKRVTSARFCWSSPQTCACGLSGGAPSSIDEMILTSYTA